MFHLFRRKDILFGNNTMPIPHIILYCFLFLFTFLLLRFLIKSYAASNSALRQPPGPPALPFIGHLHLLSSALPKTLETLALRYGPLMQIRLGPLPLLVVSNSTITKEILKTHDIDFASKFEFGASHHNIYSNHGFINGPYGPYWRFMKKLCVTRLFAGVQIERFVYIREQEILKLLRSLKKSCDTGEACDLSTEIGTLTNNMLCRMAMSKRCLKNANQAMEIRKLVREIMGFGAKLSFAEVFGPLKKLDLFGKGKKLEAALWRYDEVMEQIIKEYEEDEIKSDELEGKDLMDILLETYRDPNAELKINRKHIKFFFLEMFMAGVDTTTAATQWAMAELIQQPKILKKLRQEIDSVVGSTRVFKESDVPNLPFLQAVVKETLRLHTPGPILRRQCNKDTNINGFHVKANTKILINVYAMMRDPHVWNGPDEFRPERFLENAGGRQMEIMKGQDFQYLPFGSGRRACLGESHASIVMHTTIGALIQCFDWKLKGEDEVEIKVVTGYSGAIANSLVCYPITRLDLF